MERNMIQCSYNYFEYTAGSGDTYAFLAEKFNVSQKALIEQNKGIKLFPGAKVKIPSRYGGCSCGAFYTLKKGETLYRIAKQNGLAVLDLLEVNPYLNPSHYLPGQVIVLPPKRKGSSPEDYTLGQNERLVDVLRRFHMDITTFCTLNPGIDPMHLKTGQKIKIKKEAQQADKTKK